MSTHARTVVGRACATATPSGSSNDVTANRQAVRGLLCTRRRAQLVVCTRRNFAFRPLNCHVGLLWRACTCARYLNAHPTWAIRVSVFPSLSICGAQSKDHRAVLRLVPKKRVSGRTAVWPLSALVDWSNQNMHASRQAQSIVRRWSPTTRKAVLHTHPRRRCGASSRNFRPSS
jgi:hypothetical protein